MKQLKEFEGAKGIVIASRVLTIMIDLLKDPRNYAMNGETDRMKIFGTFMENSPDQMMRLFAILSEENPETFTCNAQDAMINMMKLANDPVMMSLFISQGRRGDAKSSVSASGNTEE